MRKKDPEAIARRLKAAREIGGAHWRDIRTRRYGAVMSSYAKALLLTDLPRGVTAAQVRAEFVKGWNDAAYENRILPPTRKRSD